MTISHVSTIEDFVTSHESFLAMSTILIKAQRAVNSNIILHLPNASKGDGNLASIFAAMNHFLAQSNNLLIILPKKYRSYRGPFFPDIFRVTTSRFLSKDFWHGGTEVCSFEPCKYFEFATYLENKAFQYSQLAPSMVDQLKFFLFHLFENASHHGDSTNPIFICSSCRNGLLKFTLADCGQGFFKRIKQLDSEIINEEEAIISALRGNCYSESHKSGCLKSLKSYCVGNNGFLIVISGSTSVTVEKENEFKMRTLPGPFRGAIISLSIKI